MSRNFLQACERRRLIHNGRRDVSLCDAGVTTVRFGRSPSQTGALKPQSFPTHTHWRLGMEALDMTPSTCKPFYKWLVFLAIGLSSASAGTAGPDFPAYEV
jgi:hypothetical protein